MIHVEDHDRVRVLRFDRPDRLNAFDHEQYGRLADGLESADSDAGVGVVVLTGTGRAFSAGADLTAIADPALAPLFLEQFMRMLDAFSAMTKPIIAAVNGMAIGVGTTMLLHCDLVLADAEARFRTPFPQLNTTPEAGSSVLMPRLIGPQFANWMLLTGDWIDAETAVRFGLAANVYPAGTVLDASIELAHRIAAHTPAALAAAKRLVAYGLASEVKAAIQRESAEASALLAAGHPSALSPRPPS